MNSFCLIFKVLVTKNIIFPRFSTNIGCGLGYIHSLETAAWFCSVLQSQRSSAFQSVLSRQALHPFSSQQLCVFSTTNSTYLMFFAPFGSFLMLCHPSVLWFLEWEINVIISKTVCWGWKLSEDVPWRDYSHSGKNSFLWPVFSLGDAVSTMATSLQKIQC